MKQKLENQLSHFYTLDRFIIREQFSSLDITMIRNIIENKNDQHVSCQADNRLG